MNTEIKDYKTFTMRVPKELMKFVKIAAIQQDDTIAGIFLKSVAGYLEKKQKKEG